LSPPGFPGPEQWHGADRNRHAAERRHARWVPAEPALGLVGDVGLARLGAAVCALILAIGVAPGQPPPTPMFSGAFIAVLSAALLLVSAPRFFGHQETRGSGWQRTH